MRRNKNFKPFKFTTPNYRETPAVPSEVIRTQPSFEKIEYEGEMLERERAAQEEIERKKTRVAILCPKSTYQYITDEALLRDIGKKTSQLSD